MIPTISFVELASDFVDEEIDAEESDDADGKDWEGEEEEEGEDNDAQESPLLSSSGARSPPSYRVVGLGATASGSTGMDDNQRGRCKRCSGRSGGTGTSKDGEMGAKELPYGGRRRGSRSNSRGSSRSSSRCSSGGSENDNSISTNRPCVTTLSRVGAVTIDTVAGGEEGEGTRKTPLGDGDVVGIADSTDSRAVGENQWPEYRTRPSRYAENKSRTSGSNGGGDDSVIHSGAVRCCVKNCAGLVAVESQPESDRVGAKARRLGRTRRGVRQEEEEEGEGLVEELSMRAEAKC